MRRTDPVLKVLAELAPADTEFSGADLVDLTGYGGPTIYGVLARLATAGFVTRRDETAREAKYDPRYNGHRPRAFYRITADGRDFFNDHKGGEREPKP